MLCKRRLQNTISQASSLVRLLVPNSTLLPCLETHIHGGGSVQEAGSFSAHTSIGYNSISTTAAAFKRLKAPLPARSSRGLAPGGGKDRKLAEGHRDSTVDVASQALPEPKPDLVERYLSLEMVSRKEAHKATFESIMKEFERFPGDTGSSEVQVALLTSKIGSLAEHLKIHRKDHSSRRGLRAMLNQRRQLLQYLRRNSFDRYCFCLSKLGLKDSTFRGGDRFSLRYNNN